MTLASISQTYGGNLNFAIGPIPFSVTWSFLVTGSVKASYAVHPISIEGDLGPDVAATVGLEGGPDIKVAKAGVDGQFSIVDAQLVGDTAVGFSTDATGEPAICYNSAIKLDLDNILGGSLSAYAQIGRPDRKIFNLPAGWRGDMKFVNWTGISKTVPVAFSGTQCLPFVR